MPTLNAGPHTAPRLSRDAVRSALELVLRSQTFRAARRTSQLLTFLVDETLLGRGAELKEHVIGVEVFGRSTDYDPHTDSVVRVQAGRLRTRLSQYYAGEGKNDPIEIDLPPGRYAPTFRSRDQAVPEAEFPPADTRPLRIPIRASVAAGFVLCLVGAVWIAPSVAARVTKRTAVAAPATPAPETDQSLAPYTGVSAFDAPVSSFETAVLRFPRQAPLWAGLANRFNVLELLGESAEPNLRQKAAEAASRALAIDPALPSGSAVAAWIGFYRDRKGAASYKQMQIAADSYPQCEICKIWYSLALAAGNRFDLAVPQASAVASGRRHSYLASYNLAAVLYYAGRFDEAGREARYAIDLSPANASARALLAASQVMGKNAASALSSPFLARRGEPSAQVLARTAAAYAALGDPGRARAMLKILQERSTRLKSPGYQSALVLAALGESHRAIQALQAALERREPDLIFVKVEPAFAALRPDPRFQAIGRTILPE